VAFLHIPAAAGENLRSRAVQLELNVRIGRFWAGASLDSMKEI
jgi:hypothetical protein